MITAKWGIVDDSGEKSGFLGITQIEQLFSSESPRQPLKTHDSYMLLGEYRHSVDTKGRVAIPAKFRDDIGSGAIVTRGIDNCLFVFGPEEWESLAAKLMALPLAQANSRAFVRLMLSGATDVELDSQGRALIPEYLRTYAGIEKEVVLTGLYNRVEIWDTRRWDEYKAKTEHASEEIAEHLGALGI